MMSRSMLQNVPYLQYGVTDRHHLNMTSVGLAHTHSKIPCILLGWPHS